VTVTIGVDPGQTGAIALVDSDGTLITCTTCRSPAASSPRHSSRSSTTGRAPAFGTVVIEDVHSMPKQGVASSFKFGRSKGVAEGVFAGAGRPLVYVAPSKWKKDLALGADKDGARRRAIETWPGEAHLFKRKMDADRAEAALFALWHQRSAT
jgi:hypothetical protein